MDIRNPDLRGVVCFDSDDAMLGVTANQVPVDSYVSFRINDNNTGDNQNSWISIDVSGNINVIAAN
jgi:hypothetical protein